MNKTSYRLFHYFGIILPFIILGSCIKSDIKESSINDEFIKHTEDTSVFNSTGNIAFILNFQRKPKIDVPNVKGRVKTISQTNYWFKKSKGEKLEMVEKKLNKILYEFDDKNRLTLFDTYRDDNEKFFVNHYVYSEDGYLISEKESNATRFIVNTIPYFSKENVVFKKLLINSHGITIGKSNLTFDIDNRKIEEVREWTDAKAKDKTISIFDEKGRILSKTFFEKPLKVEFDNFPEKVFLYFYDNKDYCIREETYNPWGLTEDYKSRLNSIISYTYDENGNILASKEKDSKGALKNVIEMNYEYDKKNNWITCLVLKNGVKESFYKRAINY